jgi:hypothetical protein
MCLRSFFCARFCAFSVPMFWPDVCALMGGGHTFFVLGRRFTARGAPFPSPGPNQSHSHIPYCGWRWHHQHTPWFADFVCQEQAGFLARHRPSACWPDLRRGGTAPVRTAALLYRPSWGQGTQKPNQTKPAIPANSFKTTNRGGCNEKQEEVLRLEVYIEG